MSDMKCPFCNGKLYGCIGHPYCRNEKCEMCDEMMPQELLDLLERTRKALDVAVDALDAGKTLADIAGFKMLVAGLEKALEQITSLTKGDDNE